MWLYMFFVFEGKKHVKFPLQSVRLTCAKWQQMPIHEAVLDALPTHVLPGSCHLGQVMPHGYTLMALMYSLYNLSMNKLWI